MRNNGSLRIIAGEYGSRRIEAPPGNTSRPTADRVREAMFSMLMPAVEGAEVLDLFAGSGALSFEALSRGAAEALLCDRDAAACSVILRNIEALGLASRVRLERRDALSLLERLAGEGKAFDLIFLDPPYHQGFMEQALAEAAKVLRRDGRIVAETDASYEIAPPEGLISVFDRKYGDTRVYAFMHKGEEG